MKNSTRAFIGIEVAVAVVVVGGLLYFGRSIYRHIPFLPHGTKPNPAQVALAATTSEESKIGQQYAAATTQALAQTKASDDPALALAKQLAPKADNALSNGLGALTPEQSLWVQNLISNALSAEVAKRAEAAQAIVQKDNQLVELDTKAQALEKKLSESQGSESLLWYWIKFAIGAYLFVHFVLPWLGTKFPVLGTISSGIMAVLSPVMADLRVKEQTALAEVKAKVGTALANVRAQIPVASAAVVKEFDGLFNNTPHQDDIAAAASTALGANAVAAAQAKETLAAAPASAV